MKHIVIIVGSLRNGSFNKQLAEIIQNKLNYSIEILDYHNIPFMNEDKEFPTPIEISNIRNTIKKADGIWIISPEYNGDIPGVLKNLIDWLSRPEIYNDWETGSILKNKKVTISSVAGKSKGIGVRTSLHKLLNYLQMNIIHDLGVGISFNQETFTTQQLKPSIEEEKLIEEQIQQFIQAIEKD